VSDDDLFMSRRRRGRGRPSVQDDFYRRVPEELMEIDWPEDLSPPDALATTFPPLTPEELALLDQYEVRRLNHPEDPHTDEERRLATQHDWALVTAALERWRAAPERPLDRVVFETVLDRTSGRFNREAERRVGRVRVHIIRLLARERQAGF
jgi:hypothetical protein